MLVGCLKQKEVWGEQQSEAALNWKMLSYHILSSIFEYDAEIFPVHYTWKGAEKGFQIAFMMNKLAMNISFEIKNNFFCQQSLWNSGEHYTSMHIILDRIQ